MKPASINQKNEINKDEQLMLLTPNIFMWDLRNLEGDG